MKSDNLPPSSAASMTVDAVPGIPDGAYALDSVIKTVDGKTFNFQRDQMKIFTNNRFMFAFFDDQTNEIDAAAGYAVWTDGVLTETPIANQDGPVEGLDFEIAIGSGWFLLELSVLKIINYLLMSIFFFVVGLEIKRELTSGHLASLKKAMLPLVAAIGGMAFPALIYLAIAGREAPAGWGVPVATDIALAVGLYVALSHARVIAPTIP